MNKRRLIAILLLTAAAALTVAAYLTLPDTLIVQISTGGKTGATMPKPLALLIPLAMTAVFAVLYARDAGENRAKYLLVSLLGIAVFILMFIVNH